MSIPPGSLIAEIDFLDPACFTNGGTSVTDLSGSGNNWTLDSNSYTYNSTVGSLALPIGNNLLSDNSTLLGSGVVPFTVSFWHYATAASESIFYNGCYPTGYIGPQSNWNAGTSTLIYRVNTETGPIDTGSISINTWHLFTVQYDTTNLKIFVDGIEQASAARTINQTPSGTYPGIQFMNIYDNTGVAGLALINIYDVAISSADILALYNSTKNRFSLVASYDFSDPACYSGSGNTVYDLAGTNNLTLYNSPTLTGSFPSKTLVFNGTNQYAKKSSPLSNMTQTFTYNVWARYPSVPNPAVANVVLAYGSLYPSNSFTALLNNFINSNLTFITAGATVNLNSGISANQTDFYNMIVTNDGSVSNNIKFYVNGTLVGTGTYSESFEPSAIFTIGSNIDDAIFSNCEVALVEIYNVGLGSTAVTNLYNSQSYRFDHLVASYDLNSLTSYPGTGNTLYDLSGNNFDITLSNTSYYDSTTYDYNSLVFTKAATSIGTYSGSFGLGTTNPNFTFFMWVKPVDVTNGVNYSWFISYGKEDGTLGGAPMILPYYAGSQNLSTGFGSGKALIQTGTGLTLNDWVSLATTCDGTTYKIYKNGAQIGSTTLSGAQIVAPEVLALNYLTGNPGLGTLDYELNLLQVYDKALSLGEISTLHNDTVDRFTVPTTPVLIGSYDFSDPACWPGSGSTVFDLTTENNDLAITATGFGGVGQSKYATFNGDTTYLYRSQFSASGSTFSSDNFTLSLWHNYGNGQSNQATMIMGGNGAAAQGIQLQVNGADSDKITAAFGIEITEGGQLVGIANTANTWHMSTVTGDGSLLKLYQDGAFIGSTTQIGSWDGRGFIIGRGLGASYQPSPLGPGLRYSGLIAIAEVYSGALGSTAISDLYDLQQPRFYPPVPSPLVASYDFSDPACYPGTGNTVFDLSDVGLDLPIVNATYAGTGQSKYFNFTGANEYIGTTGVTGLGTTFTINMWARQNDNNTLYHSFNGGYVNAGGRGPAIYWNDGAAGNIAPSFNYGLNKITYSGVATSEWYMSTYVLDGTTAKLYIDGTLVGSTSQTGFWDDGVFVLAAATDTSGNIEPAGYFVGDIAIFDVYNTALGSTAISNEYNNTVTRFQAPQPPYAGNVGGRQFNQGFNG